MQLAGLWHVAECERCEMALECLSTFCAWIRMPWMPCSVVLNHGVSSAQEESMMEFMRETGDGTALPGSMLNAVRGPIGLFHLLQVVHAYSFRG
jgi:hypothetical protein